MWETIKMKYSLILSLFLISTSAMSSTDSFKAREDRALEDMKIRTYGQHMGRCYELAEVLHVDSNYFTAGVLNVETALNTEKRRFLWTSFGIGIAEVKMKNYRFAVIEATNKFNQIDCPGMQKAVKIDLAHTQATF